MKPVCRAVIDVGTNSVKLLVANVTGSGVEPLLEKSEQTRLGQGFYESHRLNPALIEHTARVVAEFTNLARTWKPVAIRAVATSAARDAINQGDLIQAIHRASGLMIEVLTGEQEADWVYRGVLSDPDLAPHPVLILDVGGGSTEFVLGNGPRQLFRQSYGIGSVRLLEQFNLGDPPTPSEWVRCQGFLR